MSISNTETSLTLAGFEPVINSILIDGQLVDFTAYDGTLESTTAGTPYTLSLSGYDNQDDAFINETPPLVDFTVSDHTPALIAQMVGKNGASVWQFDSTDSPSEVSQSGYFANGVALGMKVGDVVTQIDTVGATVHHMYTVKSLNSDGSVNLSDGTVIN